jgi:hypothetical protein
MRMGWWWLNRDAVRQGVSKWGKEEIRRRRAEEITESSRGEEDGGEGKRRHSVKRSRRCGGKAGTSS